MEGIQEHQYNQPRNLDKSNVSWRNADWMQPLLEMFFSGKTQIRYLRELIFPKTTIFHVSSISDVEQPRCWGTHMPMSRHASVEHAFVSTSENISDAEQ